MDLGAIRQAVTKYTTDIYCWLNCRFVSSISCWAPCAATDVVYQVDTHIIDSIKGGAHYFDAIHCFLKSHFEVSRLAFSLRFQKAAGLTVKHEHIQNLQNYLKITSPHRHLMYNTGGVFTTTVITIWRQNAGFKALP